MHVRRVRKAHGGAIAEFGPALFIFLIIFLFPCINLILYGANMCAVTAICEEASRAAAVASTTTEAIQLASGKASAMEAAFGAFLTPKGGMNANGKATGCTLKILTYKAGSEIGNGIDVSNGPSAVPPGDQYEYQIIGNFTVNPFLNMQGIPFVGQVPGVGAPAQTSYAATSQVENEAGVGQ